MLSSNTKLTTEESLYHRRYQDKELGKGPGHHGLEIPMGRRSQHCTRCLHHDRARLTSAGMINAKNKSLS